ncbi:hypothetical protein [Anaerosacchariphilus polymeriproducens]|nr:hypothetical protein [Anaerosacchariphilus polymeriproducens]
MKNRNNKPKSTNKTKTQNSCNNSVQNSEAHKPSTHSGIDRERRDGPGGN